MSRRIDIEVGQRAWEVASRPKGELEFKAYRSRAIELATMLHYSGLCQTLSFLASRQDEHQRRVAIDVADELSKHLTDMPGSRDGLGPCLKYLINADESTRALADHRARLFADWLKRAVETIGHDQTPQATKQEAGES